MLYERIQTAKKHSEKKWKAADNTTPDSYPRWFLFQVNSFTWKNNSLL